MSGWIWVIVVVVVIVVVGGLLLARRQRVERRRTEARELRQDAAGQGAGLTESQRRAEELRAEADLAKAQAERAQEEAAEAGQAVQVERAGYEDRVREADRVDPDVDTRDPDYAPDVWDDQKPDGSRASTSPSERESE